MNVWHVCLSCWFYRYVLVPTDRGNNSTFATRYAAYYGVCHSSSGNLPASVQQQEFTFIIFISSAVLPRFSVWAAWPLSSFTASAGSTDVRTPKHVKLKADTQNEAKVDSPFSYICNERDSTEFQLSSWFFYRGFVRDASQSSSFLQMHHASTLTWWRLLSGSLSRSIQKTIPSSEALEAVLVQMKVQDTFRETQAN